MLAAPVSGNPKVAESGRLTIVASGPQEAWERARPYLELLCRGSPTSARASGPGWSRSATT